MENSGDDDNNKWSWFDVRVFYVRITNILVDDSTPESLTVNHIPLSLDTLLQVNGVRCGIMFQESGSGLGPTSQSQLLRRSVVVDHHTKKISKEAAEATFVSTDRIRFTGSVRFEVFSKDELMILSGVLEMSKAKTWNIQCEDVMVEAAAGNGFFKQRESMGAAMTMEVFVAGSFSGSPVILTKTVRISRKSNKIRMKKLLDSIPEYETSYYTTTTATAASASSYKQDLIHHQQHLQVVEYGRSRNRKINNKTEGEEEEEEEEEDNRNSLYSDERLEDYYHMEGEDDGELSWFNDGVRVGVGIGLGVCLGLGVGVGLLVRSYQATTRNFKRMFS